MLVASLFGFFLQSCVFDQSPHTPSPDPSEVTNHFLTSGGWKWNQAVKVAFDKEFLLTSDSFTVPTMVEFRFVRLDSPALSKRDYRLVIRNHDSTLYTQPISFDPQRDSVLSFLFPAQKFFFSIRPAMIPAYGDSLGITAKKMADFPNEIDDANTEPVAFKTDSIYQTRIFPTADADYFKINVLEKGIYTWSVNSIPSNIFLLCSLSLHNQPIYIGEQRDNTVSSLEQGLLLDPGDYRIKFSSRYNQFNSVPFDFKMEQYLRDIWEPNDDDTTLIPYIEFGSKDIASIVFTMYPAGDVDNFLIRVTDTINANLSVSGTDASHHLQGYLIGANNIILIPALNTQLDTSWEVYLTPGDYRLFVKSVSSAMNSPNHDYVFQLKRQ